MVIEHHWATRLRDAVRAAGGRTLMQAMITPEAVALVGDELRAHGCRGGDRAGRGRSIAAAIDIAQTLAARDLIEEMALEEAADTVATALAIEDAAAEDVVQTLYVAGLIEESADPARRRGRRDGDGRRGVRRRGRRGHGRSPAEAIKRAAAIDAVRALVAAEIIEGEAAEEAAEALVIADLIEREAAKDAAAAIREPSPTSKKPVG